MIKFDVIIPARLKSTRFPQKIFYKFYGLPMVEHVRRRALLIKGVSNVFVATCDQEVFELIQSNGGEALMRVRGGSKAGVDLYATPAF